MKQLNEFIEKIKYAYYMQDQRVKILIVGIIAITLLVVISSYLNLVDYEK